MATAPTSCVDDLLAELKAEDAAAAEQQAEDSAGACTDDAASPSKSARRRRRKKAEQFSAFSDATISGDYVAFVGRGEAGTLGVYRAQLKTGEMLCVADNRLPIPGSAGAGFFGDFPQPPSVHRDGSMSFRALASGEESGIYSFRAGALRAAG